MTRITDVARAAGVSPATVSRVFNQPELVTPDKRERVLAVVRDLDYKPNAAARNLRSGSVNTISLLVGDISQVFHGALAKAIGRRGEELGYNVLLCDLDHKEQRLIDQLNTLQPTDTDGIIIATADDLDREPIRSAIAGARSRGLRVISTSQALQLDVPAVVPRWEAMAHLATVHLVTQGIWPLIFIGGGPGARLSLDMQAGYERACAELGHSDVSAFVLNGRFSIADSRAALDAVLSRNSGRCGVVAANLQMAIGALQAAAENNLRLPQDMVLICCEELPLAAELRPAVSSVGIDLDTLATAAFAAIEATSEQNDTVYLPHRLTVRTSSAPIAAVVEPVT